MIRTFLLALLLTFSLVAGATTLGAAACTAPANNTFCDVIPNDAGEVIDFARVVYPQVYLGGGLYQPAYEAMTVTVAGVAYTTQPWAYGITKTATGLKDWDLHYTGIGYSAGGQALSFDVYLHQHDGTAGGRVARTIHTYRFLSGTVQ